MIALFNGKVYTNNAFFEAIILEGKFIKKIGSNKEVEQLISEADVKIDLKGKVVVPGFIDSHAHGAHSLSLGMDSIDLTQCDSVESYLETIEKYITEHPDEEVYRGIGWQSPFFGEEGPEKELLDKICDSKPIVLKAIEGHGIWVNSNAIELAGITRDTLNPSSGVIVHNRDGSVRGQFKEEAQDLIEDKIPDFSVGHYKKAILEYQKEMVAYGITGACEMDMKRNSNMHMAYRELANEDRLLIKAGMHYRVKSNEGKNNIITEFSNPNKMYENKLVDGYFAKIFVDGVVENATAWLKEPYETMSGWAGKGLWPDEKLFEACKTLYKLGYDLHFHCIGDAAVSQVVRTIEKIKSEGKTDSHHRTVIAHVQIADKTDISKMANLGISVSANPYWFGKERNYYYKVEKPLLGDRAEHQYPMKSLLDAGVIVSSGSDYSVTPEPNPIMAIKTGMERSFRDIFPGCDEVLGANECADFMSMFNSVTINAAYTSRMERKTGSLEEGKYADLAVLSENIFETPASQMQYITVDMTISEGEIVYCHSDEMEAL